MVVGFYSAIVSLVDSGIVNTNIHQRTCLHHCMSRANASTHTHTHTYRHTHIHAHTYARTRAHTNTHTHTHKQTLKFTQVDLHDFGYAIPSMYQFLIKSIHV